MRADALAMQVLERGNKAAPGRTERALLIRKGGHFYFSRLAHFSSPIDNLLRFLPFTGGARRRGQKNQLTNSATVVYYIIGLDLARILGKIMKGIRESC